MFILEAMGQRTLRFGYGSTRLAIIGKRHVHQEFIHLWMRLACLWVMIRHANVVSKRGFGTTTTDLIFDRRDALVGRHVALVFHELDRPFDSCRRRMCSEKVLHLAGDVGD